MIPHAHGHKAKCIKTWLAKVRVEKLEWPTQNPHLYPTEYFWDELDPSALCLTSVTEITNVLVAE